MNSKDFIILEPWARAAASLKNVKQRCAFWDAIASYAMDGVEPDPDDGVGVMAVAMARRIIDERRNKSNAGRKGGRASAETMNRGANGRAEAKQTPSTNQAEAEQTPSTNQAEAEQTPSTVQHERKKEGKNERMNEASDQGRAQRPVDRDFIVEAAAKWGAPADFADYFVGEMDKLGWEVIDSKYPERTFRVTAANVSQVIRSWWARENKKTVAPRAVESHQVTGSGRPSECIGSDVFRFD